MAETIIRTITTPYTYPSGLVYVKPYLYCAFKDVPRIVVMDTNGNIIRDVAAPGPTPRGLGFDGKHFWLSDSGTYQIFKLNRNLVVEDEYRSPFSAPRAIAFDGKHLFLFEFGSTYRLYLYNLDFSLYAIHYSGFTDINGAVFIGNFLWFSDATAVKVYVRHKSGFDVANYTITALKPRGLAHDGTYFYLCEAYASKIYVLTF